MNALLSAPGVQIILAALTVLGTIWVARFNRSGAKEANQTTSWTNLVSALQKTNADMQARQDELDSHIRELDGGNRELAKRVFRLERSRRAWKTWGQRVVSLMEDRGIGLPSTPESLDDTDPNMERI